MKKNYKFFVDTTRINPEKIKAISDDLCEIGIDFEKEGKIECDDTDKELCQKITKILDKHLS